MGMKTGYTQMAGRTLVSCAQRNGQKLIAVTLSDPDDMEGSPPRCWTTASRPIRNSSCAGGQGFSPASRHRQLVRL